MKKILKNRCFLCLLTAIIVGTVSVSAVTYFPSNQTTYDNKASGLNATNVQDAIDELYKKADSSTINSSKLKDLVVTTGSGLYADEYEEGRYIYRGNYVDNYITFNNEEWRILSIEKDGTMKIINLTETGMLNNNTTPWGSTSYSWTSSSVNTYLNGTYYNKLSTTAKNLIVARNFNVGNLGTKTETNLQLAVQSEKTSKWNGKVAIITVTEFLRTNTASSCTNFPTNLSYYSTDCGDTTWLNYVPINNGWTVADVGWLLNHYKDSNNYHWVFRTGTLTQADITDGYRYGVFPVVHIKSGLQLSGYGSKTHPFIIES